MCDQNSLSRVKLKDLYCLIKNTTDGTSRRPDRHHFQPWLGLAVKVIKHFLTDKIFLTIRYNIIWKGPLYSLKGHRSDFPNGIVLLCMKNFSWQTVQTQNAAYNLGRPNLPIFLLGVTSQEMVKPASLPLKRQEKNASKNVVCWSLLLQIIA